MKIKKINYLWKRFKFSSKPNQNIYLGNSGTSARLLTGLLSSQKFNSLINW